MVNASMEKELEDIKRELARIKLEHAASIARLTMERDMHRERADNLGSLNAKFGRKTDDRIIEIQKSLDKAKEEYAAASQAAQTRFSEQAKRISELTTENASLKTECESLRKQYDPEIRAAERAEKARQLEKLKADAARLEREIAATE